jgi:hypothetical protein
MKRETRWMKDKGTWKKARGEYELNKKEQKQNVMSLASLLRKLSLSKQSVIAY